MSVDHSDRIIQRDSDTVLGVDRVVFSNVLRDDETVTVGDLFGDEFVQEYTEAETFQSFLVESPVSVESVSDFEDVSAGELDQYVAETTDFQDWQSMVRAASEEYVQRNTAY